MSNILLFRSSRNSSSLQIGLGLASQLEINKESDKLILILMQDAVILALRELSQFNLPKISEGYVLSDHLAKRGFTQESLRPPFQTASYSDIIKLMMSGDAKVLGSF